MMIKESKAYQYALWCIDNDNKYVGRYVKKQAKSWIEIVNNKSEEAYFDEKAYKKICKILKLMVHPDLGCTIFDGLEPYAWFLIVSIFCTKLKENGKLLNIRYYESCLLEISRKNYKTFNSAIIFIIGLLIEPRFSRFFSVAPDFKLSNELRLAVRKILKVSPLLESDKYFKINRDMIVCTLTDIEYTPLAYSNDKMDGKLANIFLADEAGALDQYPVEAMRSSQITLNNKLGIIISTQYPNYNNVMIDEIDYAKKVLDNIADNKRYFSLLYEPDDEICKEWADNDLVIYQSNPVAYSNENIFKAIKDKRTMAILYENKRENYLCKHNNIRYKGLGAEGYIDINKVRECERKEDLEWWKGRKVFLGLDLSISDDNTAVAMVTEENGIIYAKVFGFIPKDKKDYKSKKENVDYNKLISDGVCFECGDEVIDYSYIERKIMELQDTYKVKIEQIGYDRYNALSTVQKLEANKYTCVQIKQHSSILHSPTKLIKEKILSNKFFYDSNKLLEINFQNARCTEDTNLNKYVNKKQSKDKVDMVVALINACYLLEQELLNNKPKFGVQVISFKK